MTAANRAYARVSARHDAMEPQDGDDTLATLKDALYAIEAFRDEADDNASLALRHRLHLHGCTGDKAAYESLRRQISDDYAERLFHKLLRLGYSASAAADDLLSDHPNTKESA